MVDEEKTTNYRIKMKNEKMNDQITTPEDLTDKSPKKISK